MGYRSTVGTRFIAVPLGYGVPVVPLEYGVPQYRWNMVHRSTVRTWFTAVPLEYGVPQYRWNMVYRRTVGIWFTEVPLNMVDRSTVRI